MPTERVAAETVFQSRSRNPADFVVAIPARNEADRLPACLDALGRQTGIELGRVGIVVGLNNTTDRSLAVCTEIAAGLGCGMTVLDATLPAEIAHAGWARKLALDEALRQCAPGGLLLTTDADAVVDDDWIASTLAAMELGADAVAGFVTADWEELRRLDEAILDRGALEWAYQGLLAAYEAVLDPRAWDPAPRHNQMCGASLAVRREAYAAVGGMRPAPVGEDRALIEALLRHDFRVRHGMEVHVTASARTAGRASGGMADALRLRHDPDYPCDDILESVDSATLRWHTRHQLRASWGAWAVDEIAADLHLDRAFVEQTAAEPYFGKAWEILEDASPMLEVQLVTARTLPGELERLRALCPIRPAFG